MTSAPSRLSPDLNVRSHCRDYSVIIALVEAGLGAAFLPGLALRDRPIRARVIPVDPPLARTVLVAVKPARRHHPAVAAMLGLKGIRRDIDPERYDRTRKALVHGQSGFPMIGSPDDVADELARISQGLERMSERLSVSVAEIRFGEDGEMRWVEVANEGAETTIALAPPPPAGGFAGGFEALSGPPFSCFADSL